MTDRPNRPDVEAIERKKGRCYRERESEITYYGVLISEADKMALCAYIRTLEGELGQSIAWRRFHGLEAENRMIADQRDADRRYPVDR